MPTLTNPGVSVRWNIGFLSKLLAFFSKLLCESPSFDFRERCSHLPFILASETRLAVKSLLRHRWLSLFVVGLLTVGIALASAGFLAFRELALDPLPYPDSDALYEVSMVGSLGSSGLSPEQFEAVSRLDVFSEVGAFRLFQACVHDTSGPAQTEALRATPSLLRTLRMPMILGRGFESDDSHTALISYALWQSRFAGEEDALGAPIQVEGHTLRIIGVLPREAVVSGEAADIWIPFDAERQGDFRSTRFVQVIGRLSEPTQTQAAQQRLAALLAPEGGSARRAVLSPLKDAALGHTADMAALLQVATGGVLVATSAAVILILLVFFTQGAQRQALIMRKFFGGGNFALAVRLATLTGSLVFPAAFLGLASAYGFRLWAIQWKANIVQFQDLRIDSWLLAVIGALSLVTFLGCFLPVFFYSIKASPQEAIASCSPRVKSSRLKAHGMVLAVEICLALVLVVAANASLTSLLALYNRPLGFDPHRSFAAFLPSAQPEQPAVQQAFWDNLLAGLSKADGIEHAAVVSRVPFFGGRDVFLKPMPDGQEKAFQIVSGSSEVFSALDIRLLRGRSFTDEDMASSASVAILNQTAARILFPDVQDPVGRVVHIIPPASVVGVSADHIARASETAAEPTIWLPYAQHPRGNALIVRGSIGLPALTSLLRSRVDELDPERPIKVSALDHIVQIPLQRPGLATSILSAFACALTLLTLVIVAGTMTFSFKGRRRDIAIRMAHGARHPQILFRELVGVAIPFAIGGGGGLLGGQTLTTFLSSLFPVPISSDFGTWATSILVFGILGFAVAALCVFRQARSTEIAAELSAH